VILQIGKLAKERFPKIRLIIDTPNSPYAPDAEENTAPAAITTAT
jgi:hypothetical protein